MRKKLLAALAAVGFCAAALAGISTVIRATMPDYPASLAPVNATEKITGTWLVSQGAAQDGSLLILGSSELKTTDILTHPANFFAGSGIQVDLVGRGSCQSIIHAMLIGSQGSSLQGRKIVLITAPQSYVPEGIASDLFMANYSQEQLLNILLDDTLPDEIKTYLAGRVQALFDRYAADTGTRPQDGTAGDVLSAAWAEGRTGALELPYAALSRWMLETRDLVDARACIAENEAPELPEGRPELPEGSLDFDWDAWERAAMEQAAEMATNNSFTMQDSYYATYIGARLEQQAGQDVGLSYAQSPEYDDLRCLLELCRLRDLEVLFVHVPMHGGWYDYTGFPAEERAVYYENVRQIVSQYENVELLDLTGREYEPYFLCDTMHLGWKGWLAVDRAIVDFYQ